MNTKKKPCTYKYRQLPQTDQYGKGGFWSKLGGTAYGVLEGTLDTITGGLTDGLTDRGYAALSKLDGTKNDEEINKFRGAGTMAGAVVGGVVSGNVAGASQQGLKGASQTFTNSKVSNTLGDLSQVAGLVNLAQGVGARTPAPDKMQALMPTSIPSPTPSMALKLPKNIPFPTAYGGPIYRKLGPLQPLAYGGPTDPPKYNTAPASSTAVNIQVPIGVAQPQLDLPIQPMGSPYASQEHFHGPIPYYKEAQEKYSEQQNQIRQGPKLGPSLREIMEYGPGQQPSYMTASGRKVDENYYEPSTENFFEFFDPTGILSHDDASAAYDKMKAREADTPNFDEALDMFGAVPLVGKAKNAIVLAKGTKGAILTALQKAKVPFNKFLDWADYINRADAVEDETDFLNKFQEWIKIVPPMRDNSGNTSPTNKMALGGPTDSNFNNWYSRYSKATGNSPDPYAKEHYYDYEKFFNDNIDNPSVLFPMDTKDWHLPSKYKKEGHPRTYQNADGSYSATPIGKDSKDTRKLAYGGPTNTNDMRFKYAAGGPLQEIEAGGSHEQNPMGGVPMGSSASVEQGETVKDDFVFSDRIKVTAQIAREFSLPKAYINKTYADASKIAEKHNKHNDHIDAKTNELITGRLKEAQEAYKSVHMPEQNPMMAQGMPGGIPPQMMAYGGRIRMAYGGERMPYATGGGINSSWDADSVQKVIDNYAKDAPITGDTLLQYANKYNVSIELALAQALNESHFGTKGRAVKTKNIFNVGNTDGGDGHDANDPNFAAFNNTQDSWEKGLDNYFSLMANEYGAAGKTYEEVINNGVVRVKDKARYASNPDYEKNLMDSIENFREISGPYGSINRGRPSTIKSGIKPVKTAGTTSVKGYNPTPVVEPFALEEGPDTEASTLRTLEDEIKSLEEKRKNIMLKKSPSLQDSKDLIELNNSISAKRKEFTNIQAPNKARARGFTVFENRENLEDILRGMKMPYEDMQKILRDPVATRKIQDILENENSYSGSVDRAAKYNQIMNVVSTHDFQNRVNPDQTPRPERSTVDPMMSLNLNSIQTEPRRDQKISGVAYPEDTFVHTEDTDAPFLNMEDTMAQLKQDQINARAYEPGDSLWKDMATNKGRQRPADKKGFLSGFTPDASMLEYAPVIANTIRGLSKPAQLDKNDYTYNSSVTATPYNIEPQQRAARNAYATAMDAGRAAGSDAGSYMSSLGNIYGAYTAQNSGLYAEKENQEAQRLMAAQSAADQAAQFNSQMGLRVDDWNQNSRDATQNHLMAAADQLGQIGGRESSYDFYRDLYKGQPNVTDDIGETPGRNKRNRALGGYFYKPKNS